MKAKNEIFNLIVRKDKDSWVENLFRLVEVENVATYSTFWGRRE